MTKTLRYSVAIVLKNADKFLIVKRPETDPDLSGNWGLPATTLKPGELPEEAARRVCREKLNCEGIPIRFIGSMTQKRNSYDLCLMDIEVLLSSGTVDNTKAMTSGTIYTSQKWTDDPMKLMAAAKHGSCCSSILLEDRGLLSREKWIDSLEGSASVA
jgi:hypothetical protein